MNKEQLRLKLIEAWSKGYLTVDEDEDTSDYWGFLIAENYNGDIAEFLGVSSDWYESEDEYDEVSIAVSKEILEFPLVKALS